jgi:hypothetical protein
MSDPLNGADRDPTVLARWEKRMRLAVRDLLTDQIIAEHQREPPR